METVNDKGNIVLMSLKPKHWENICQGKKRLELRKTAPKSLREAPYRSVRVLVYLSGSGRVVGEFEGYPAIRILEDFCHEFSELACVSVEDMLAYCRQGRKGIWAWQVGHVVVYAEGFPLSALGLSRPPQSWQYLSGASGKIH